MKQLYCIALACGMTLASCSSSDEPKEGEIDVFNPQIENLWNGKDAKLWDVTYQYVNHMVYPAYNKLAESANQLFETTSAIKTRFNNGDLNDTDIQAACEAFAQSRYYWERSEAFLYGAASDFNIDPHIDSWPLDQEQMYQFFASSKMMDGINGSDPIAFVNNNNAEFDTALGFHGIEYILFRDGNTRSAAELSANEVAFLYAVAGDLRDHCYQLEVSWMGQSAPSEHCQRVEKLGMKTRAMGNNGYYYGADLLLAGYHNSDTRYLSTTYSSMPAVVTNILVGGCSNICSEVADQKMGQAWRVLNGNGSAEDAGDYIESPYSKHSFIDYQGNIYSIQGTLYGKLDATEPQNNSIMTFLRENGYSGTDNLENALQSAIAALQSCIDSGVAFVDDPGNERVKTAIDAILSLDNELNKAAQWISKL